MCNIYKNCCVPRVWRVKGEASTHVRRRDAFKETEEEEEKETQRRRAREAQTQSPQNVSSFQSDGLCRCLSGTTGLPHQDQRKRRQ